jgi:hypothetical protein
MVVWISKKKTNCEAKQSSQPSLHSARHGVRTNRRGTGGRLFVVRLNDVFEIDQADRLALDSGRERPLK